MADSVKVVNEDVLRRIHANYAGKLHRESPKDPKRNYDFRELISNMPSHGMVAASSSIPTKYQTIVTDNSDQKGFMAKAKRFDHQVLNENPGPGSYVGHSQFEPQSSSHSKKGYGGFVSKSRRVSRTQVASGPGPGKYAMPSLLQSKQDYNRTNTGNFHQPIAQLYDKKDNLPAPNTYEPVALPKGKVNNVAAIGAFKSKTKRGSVLEDNRGNPAPGQYESSDTATQPNARVPLSSFKTNGDRNFYKKNQNPGPGTYKPHEPISDPANKVMYPKKHYLCLSAPAMPLPAPPVAPGPGAYEMRNYEGPTKHYMSSSMFVSNTTRWHSVAGDRTIPGPGAYHPVTTGKESFIYNHANRWI